MNEYVDFQNALALAIASGIGGDGEMMVQETLWEGNADTEGYEIAIDYKKYDLLVIGMCPNALETKRGTNNVLLVSKIDPSIVYIQNCATSNGSVAIRYIFENNKLIVVLVQGNSVLGWQKPSIREVIGIKFTGTKSIDYSTEEQVIGKWIDGKPLYQKTVKVYLNNTNGTNCFSDDRIENIEYAQIISRWDEHHLFGFPATYTNANAVTTSCYVSVNPNDSYYGLVIAWTKRAGEPNHNAYITIQYTKTTD